MSGWIVAVGAGVIAGAMNAMADGGSVVSLPTLIALGLPSFSANATSTASPYLGGAASARVDRDRMIPICGVPLRTTLTATSLGGLTGALLLLWTPASLFDRVLPWLLLTAIAALAFGPKVGPLLRARFRAGVSTVVSIQFLPGVYGGLLWWRGGTDDDGGLEPPMAPTSRRSTRRAPCW